MSSDDLRTALLDSSYDNYDPHDGVWLQRVAGELDRRGGIGIDA